MSDPGSSSSARVIFSIGHSNQPLDRFFDLLAQHEVGVLVDVRSQPYSRYCLHFNRPALAAAAGQAEIEYVYLGQQLGGRPCDPGFYDGQGRVLYDRVVGSEPFRQGLRRLLELASNQRVAIMCGEEDPSRCHRRLLVGAALAESGALVRHLRGDGRVQDDEELRERPLQPGLFGEEERDAWKSSRSASPGKRRRSSSGS